MSHPDEPHRFWKDLPPPGAGVTSGERALYVALCGAMFAVGVALGLTLFGAR